MSLKYKDIELQEMLNNNEKCTGKFTLTGDESLDNEILFCTQMQEEWGFTVDQALKMMEISARRDLNKKIEGISNAIADVTQLLIEIENKL